MAINPEDQYPGQIEASSAEYPFGGAQDVGGPLAEDGTPWDVASVNDTFGFYQTLLIRAGLTPTGDPETVLASQYYDALTKLFSRSADSTAALIAGRFPKGAGVQTAGFAAAGDGGGAFWAATGGTGSVSTTDYPNGKIFDADGREFAIVPGVINPRQFGAKGDGATDDVVPIQNAMDTQGGREGGPVYLNAGAYLCSAQITVPDKVAFYGDGIKATTLSFAGAGGSFPNSACVWSAGTAAFISALSVDVPPDETTLTFAAAHGLLPDDLFAVINTASSSYADGNALFKCGEYFVAASIPSGTTVLLESPAYATTSPLVTGDVDTYKAANVVMRKMTPKRFAMRDMTVIGVGATSSIKVIGMDLCRAVTLERMSLSLSALAMIQLNHCFDVTVTDVEMHNSSTTGTDHNGVQILHCQRIFLTRLRGGGSNGLISAGVGTTIDAYVNREIFITDCYATQRGDGLGAIRFLANSEHISIADTRVAGIQIGGDHIRISNCEIEGQPASNPTGIGEGWALAFLNMTGFDVRVDGCKIIARADVDATAALVFWNDSIANMFRVNTFVMNDTNIDMAGYTGIPLLLKTTTGGVSPSLRLENVNVIGSNVAAEFCVVDNKANASWKRQDFHNCRFLEVGLQQGGSQLVRHQGTVVERSPTFGIQFPNPLSNPFSVRSMRFHNCHVSESLDAGIEIADDEGRVLCMNTTSLSNNINVTKSSDRSSFVFEPDSGSGTTSLTLIDNTFGDDKAVPNQTFAYHYVDVDTVTDIGTTILGGLPVTRTPSVSDTLTSIYDEATDNQQNSGTLGLVDGDPDAAPTGAQDFAIGSGLGNRGFYLKSSATGFSRWVAGDSSDPDRFEIICDHANNEFTFVAGSVSSCQIDGGGINPATPDTNSVGDSTSRWAAMYGAAVHFARIFMDGGAIADSGDIVLNANWGTGRAVNGLTGGRDGVLRVVIDSGTSTGAFPEFTYTFPDGATSSEIPHVFPTNRGGPFSEWDVLTTSSTTVVIRFNGTPADSTQYGCNLLLVWPTD